MPDFSQRDIAQSISRWVVSQTELAQGGATIEQPQQNRFIGFMCLLQNHIIAASRVSSWAVLNLRYEFGLLILRN